MAYGNTIIGTAATLRVVLIAFGLLLAQPAIAADAKSVLVLHSNNRLAPGNIAADRGLRNAMASPSDRPVEIFSEFLDQPAFGGEAYERTVATYLREKYATRPPSAIVAVSDNALDFLLRNRRASFELRAGGYNGSTYELSYDRASDRLKGTYYQAVAKQKFDVYFARK